MQSRQLCSYALVGVLNTASHWLVFLLLHLGAGASQAFSNLAGFLVAASLSYFSNAAFTFAVPPSGARYLLFLVGMGSLSLLLGALADRLQLRPWLTLVGFSGVSLVVGYWYSRAVVFRRTKP